MCGAALNYIPDRYILKCEYCGTAQTVPKLDNDKRARMYERANNYRRNNEYDRAMGIFESILNEDTEDAEAYWSLVLCRYGVDYVKDPNTSKYVPTINRTQYKSIFDDEDYKSALSYADENQREIYKTEAAIIDKLQNNILYVAKNETPFDVFICYKETDKNGNRTVDSIYAQDIYDNLTKEGYKVFFSRITLEDKLGQAYEPYIFSALNTAKVMIVVGTNADNFNAPWVKNEWSRFLGLIKNKGDKYLIPAYKDMNAYDLPNEFINLQAQDMAKIGFLQDLVYGVKKLINKTNKPAKSESNRVDYTPAATDPKALLESLEFSLELGCFEEADKYARKLLAIEPENARVYICKLLISLQLKDTKALIDYPHSFEDDEYYIKALKFAKGDYLQTVKSYATENAYIRAEKTFYLAKNIEDLKKSKKLFEQLGDYKDSVRKLDGVKKKIAKKKTTSAIVTAIILAVVFVIGTLISNDIKARNGLKLEYDKYSDSYMVTGIGFNRDAVLTIPSTYKNKPITTIDSWAFKDCTKLTNAIIDGITSIEYEAFLDCATLTAVTIGNSVTSIGSGVFFGCTSLTTVTIGSGVTVIESSAFSGCDIESINISEENANYYSKDNCIIEKESKTLISAFKNSIIPSDVSVTAIGYGAYLGRTGLTDIIIPDSITSIDMNAFANCKNLTSVTIPDSVTSIGEHAFGNCTSLTSITLPAEVKIIDKLLFNGCTNLADITIHAGVEKIGLYAFSHCTNLTRINFTGTIAQWKAISKAVSKDGSWNDHSGDYKVYCSNGTLDKNNNLVT